MDIVKKMVTLSVAKDVMEKQAARVRAGEKDLAKPLENNIEMISLVKSASPNGVIDPKTIIAIEVEEEKDPSAIQNNIMDAVSEIKKSMGALTAKVDELGKAPLAKSADSETRWNLERMVWKFRDRMSQAQNALDTIELANLDAAKDAVGKRDAIKKMLDFDEIVAEVGEEAVEAVKKIVDEQGANDTDGDTANDTANDTDGDTDGDTGNDDTGDADAGNDDDAGADADTSGADGDADAGSDDDDDLWGETDLSPPLSSEPSDDGDDDDDGVSIEIG